MGFLNRLRATFFPQSHEQSLDHEFQFHLEMRAAELEEAGMPPEQARREAARLFGNRTSERELTRDTDRVLWVEHFFQDVRFSLRTMRKTPLVTAVAILSLALGIGANTAIFTVLDALLLKSLPIKDPQQVLFLSWTAKSFPDELVSLHGRAKASADGSTTSTAFAYPFFEDLGRRTRAISGLAAFVSLNQVPIIIDGKVTTAHAQAVSSGYYTTLGISPAIGRPLDENDDRAAAPAVAMISYRFWQSRFGGDAAVLGKYIAVHNVPCAIIGVEPRSFLGLTAGDPPDVTIPLHRLPAFGKPWNDAETPIFTAKDYWWLRIAARLHPGVSENRARAELGALFRQSLPQAEDLPVLDLRHGAEGADDLRENFQRPLIVLMCVVGVVLIIACANVGNLLLARAYARQNETLMRMVLGADRGRLIRQHLTEAVVLSSVGGALGLALAYWASGALVAALPTFGNALVFDLQPDFRILAFTAAASLATGLLYGLAPALQSTRIDLQPALQSSKRFRRGGITHVLVIAQLAASVVVLAGAGLYVRTLSNLRNIDTGMNTHNLLAFRVEPDASAGYTSARAAALYRRIQERLQMIPGVRSVAQSQQIPLSGTFHRVPVEVPGVPPLPLEQRIGGLNLVGPRFFETLGIALRLGRAIDERDRENAPRVAVINEAFAAMHFPNQSPIGRRFRTVIGPQAQMFEYEVIGVAVNTKFDLLRRSFGPGFFAASNQHLSEMEGMSFALRIATDKAAIAGAIRQAVAEIDPAIEVQSLLTLDEQIDERLKQERLFAQLSSVFGWLALVLASVGLYGVRSYSVSRRTSEIGIRIALGATRGQIIALVMRETGGLTAAGVVIGLAAGLALSQLIRSMLFGLAPHDPATFAGAALVLIAVAAVAGYLPALRAARVDPMAALRLE
jgi:predicted permease